jgi:hypothetical protein
MDPDRASGAVVLRAAELDSIGRGHRSLLFRLGNKRIRGLGGKELFHYGGVFISRKNLDYKISGLGWGNGGGLPEASVGKP